MKQIDKLTDRERSILTDTRAKDPWLRFHVQGFVIYMVVLTIVLLWPFDFLSLRNNVHWIENSNGVAFSKTGQILSASSTRDLCDTLIGGRGFSLEVWLSTGDASQSGPARIVSYSLDPGHRNFTLGQFQKKLVFRLRTTETDLNAVDPSLEIDNVFEPDRILHIVVTYDFSQQSAFINGKKRAQENLPGGGFENWDPSYYLLLGNEATCNRPWLGKIYRLAIYDRALNEAEIRADYRAGWLHETDIPKAGTPVTDGLVANYTFNERQDADIGDNNPTGRSLGLYIPRLVRDPSKPFLQWNNGALDRLLNLDGEAILNLICLIPLGFLFHGVLGNRYGFSLRSSLLVFIGGALFIFGIESLQYISMVRNSSAVDFVNNMAGISIGILIYRSCIRLLKSREKCLLQKA